MADQNRNHQQHQQKQGENNHHRDAHIEDNDRPMREFISSHASFPPHGFYATPANFEIKGSLLANLPKFKGLSAEDAQKHILRLYHTCSSMKP